MRHYNSADISKYMSVNKFYCLTERGIPEGQEDDHINYSPPKVTATIGNVTQLKRGPMQPKKYLSSSTPSKATQFRKYNDKSCKKIIKSSSKTKNSQILFNCLFSGVIKRPVEYSDKNFQELEREILLKKQSQEQHSTIKKVYLSSFEDSGKILKVFDIICTKYGKSALLIIFEGGICFASQEEQVFISDLNNLRGAVIGPFANNVSFLRKCESTTFFRINTSTTYGSARDIIANIEIAIRSWSCRRKIKPVFNVVEMNEYENSSPIEPISTKHLSKDEFIMHECVVWLQSEYVDLAEGHLQKCGFLMFKCNASNCWTPRYVRIEKDVLFVSDISCSASLCEYGIKLTRSLLYSYVEMAERPYAFKIITENDRLYFFGAADDIELNSWLQSLDMITSPIRNNLEVLPDISSATTCYVTITNVRIITHSMECSGRNLLRQVALHQIASIQHSLKDYYYCLLELQCQEACEASGDWIIHFSNEVTCDKFISSLISVLNKGRYAVRIKESTLPLRKCTRINTQVQSLWSCFYKSMK